MTIEESRIALMLSLLTDQTWRPRYDPEGKPYAWFREDSPEEIRRLGELTAPPQESRTNDCTQK